MSVVVGYRAGEVGLSGLHLAVRAARSLGTSLVVATIVPQPWLAPSFARVDAEYQQWADNLAADSANEAARFLRGLCDGIEVAYVDRAHRSVSGGLIEVVEQAGGEVVVLGSLPSGGRGPAVIGTTADWLLHASPVPVAISPRGYRARTGGLTRLTCAYAATPDSVEVVRRCSETARRFGLPLRVVTFAVRGKTMYPPEVGLHAEDEILEAWASQARALQAGLKTDRVIAEDVALEVVTGHDWGEALRKVDWQDGEILALGTRPRDEIRRVFLGSRSAKIIRESPVPVLVLPG
ncbi:MULTISPECIES: universal stress protein [unclassified Mycobacterium]|uniref:universal stress protein n=1 Tax=unclassified Mycobacterium TaxID=2642494 RepID=UPI0007FBD546|nr:MULTISPECIES: universal stress protein [unclassified Mycobacterium]OBH05157.1 universal stress protein [Mycobacterium sp. E2699]OBI47536.1 universal stress protein [Mycobacterium sp. E787]